jgi:hypothetical protein
MALCIFFRAYSRGVINRGGNHLASRYHRTVVAVKIDESRFSLLKKHEGCADIFVWAVANQEVLQQFNTTRDAVRGTFCLLDPPSRIRDGGRPSNPKSPVQNPPSRLADHCIFQ